VLFRMIKLLKQTHEYKCQNNSQGIYWPSMVSIMSFLIEYQR